MGIASVPDAEKPEWMEGWKPAPPKPDKPKRDTRWKAGQPSPNPRGRPVGRADRRLLATEQMMGDLRAIVDVQVAKALDGDPSAAALVLARVLPAVKPQAEKVCFPFDASAPVTRQIEQVLEATAAGAVAPDVARLLIDSIKALSDVRAAEELQSILITLEARQA